MKLSSLAQRVLVALWGIPLIFSAVYFGGLYFLVVVLIINSLAQFEFYKLAEKKNASPLKTVGIGLAIILSMIFYQHGVEVMWIALIPGLLFVLLIELFRKHPNAILNVATTMAGVFYPPLLFNFFILIRQLPAKYNLPDYHGAIWVFIVFGTIWMCDTAAYFIGKKFGRHKLYPSVSPNKTVEGAVAGFIFAIIAVLIIRLFYHSTFSLLNFITIGVMIGICSQLGDLIESLFKRDAAIKDSSHILPGHGGFLDRFDSPSFVAPIFFFYLNFFVF
ncbi:phosphatidate cytidylyltransferase [candidate division KSB1 bacterium]|nr:phosphatidate cytidylyltransferase [candidate division KSB1 bacterium]